MHVDPKSVKIQSSRKYLFALLGSTCIKAAHKWLLKSDFVKQLFIVLAIVNFVKHVVYGIGTSKNRQKAALAFFAKA